MSIGERRKARSLFRLAPWAGLLVLAVAAPRVRPLLERWRERLSRRKPSLSDPRRMGPEAFEHREPRRGRAAERVHHIPPPGWRDVAWRVFREIGRDRLTIVAGGVTFFTVLALFPAMGAFVSLYGLVADVAMVREQLNQLSLILPAGVVELLAAEMFRLAESRDATLGLAFAGSLLLAFWSANAGMNALVDGMNIAYGEAEKRNFIRRRITTYGATAGLILAVVVLTWLLVALPIQLRRFGLAPAQMWWVPFRWIVVLGLVTFGFGALYRYGPSRELARWSWVWPGAVGAAIGWVAVSVGFSIYLTRFANYGDAYGPLATVVAFMVWIWISALIVLLGAELNAETEHQTAVDTTTGPPAPMGERGAAMADSVGLAFRGFRPRGRKSAESNAAWQALRETDEKGAP